MKRLHAIAIAAAALAAPAGALAQTYYVERITVYEPDRYHAFVAREGGHLQSGGANLDDTLLADSVAMTFARDHRLRDIGATVSARDGRVSFTGMACSEPRLIELAYAFEQATKRRVKPAIAP